MLCASGQWNEYVKLLKREIQKCELQTTLFIISEMTLATTTINLFNQYCLQQNALSVDFSTTHEKLRALQQSQSEIKITWGSNHHINLVAEISLHTLNSIKTQIGEIDAIQHK